MPIKSYLTPLLKWWWLLLLAGAIAAGSSYWLVSWQPAIYQARATLIVGRSVFEANPTTNDLWLNQQLASFYADLAKRQPVRQATMDALGLDWLPAYTARPLPNSQLIEIAVTDVNPLRAQVVANGLADELILQSPTSAENQQQDRQAFVDEQLQKLEEEITETQQAVADQEAALADLTRAREIANAQIQLDGLRSKLALLQGNYATLLASTDQGAANTLSVIERASLPTAPIGPNRNMTVMVSVALALAIAASAAFLLEYLDDTVRNSDDILRLTELPTLANIGRIAGSEHTSKLIAERQPLAPVVEAFRVLRISLQFSTVGSPTQTFMITSSNPQEGKSLVLANLAVVMAQAGHRVIAVDSDLRRPVLHKVLGVANTFGLTDAMLNPDAPIEAYLQPTTQANLRVLASGPLPPNPADLLGSPRMDSIIQGLQSLADIVLFDSAPILYVADGTILATRMTGVILVCDAGRTRSNDAKRAANELRRLGVKLLGAVLNRQTEGGGGKYYYYRPRPAQQVKPGRRAARESSGPVAASSPADPAP